MTRESCLPRCLRELGCVAEVEQSNALGMVVLREESGQRPRLTRCPLTHGKMLAKAPYGF